MILTFFDSGTSKASSAINYLLQKNDSQGKERIPPAELFMGDEALTTHLIDNNHRKNKYTSGVLAFKSNENPTDKQLKEIWKQFLNVMAPGLSDENVNCFLVKHTHEGNLELHFLIPKVEMKSGKSFNIAPPGKKTNQLIKDFSADINDKFGWDQVRPDPFRLEFSAFDKKVPSQKKRTDYKEKISSKLVDMIKTGRLKNRDDLLYELEKIGVEVTRKGNTFVSLKFPNQEKAARFKGDIFTDGVNYSDLISKHKNRSTTLSSKERSDVFTRTQSIKLEKLNFNKKAYLTPKKQRVYKSNSKIYKTNKQAIKNNNLRISCKNALSKIQSLETEGKQPSEAFSNRLDKISKKIGDFVSKESKSSNTTSSTPSTRSHGLAGVEANIQSVIGELANAKTYEEQMRLFLKLAELMEQRRRMALELLEGANKENTTQSAHPRPRPR